MAVYRIGSQGPEIQKIQKRLQALDFYHGPIDSAFGGGTEAAVKAFQARKKLKVDGAVGPATWNTLFNAKLPAPTITSQTIDSKCLALTGSFETDQPAPECFAGLSGDFDGQGISFGVAQWNFGQDSLQPLLKELIAKSPAVVQSTFHEHYATLVAALNAPKSELMDFARSIQHPVKHVVNEPWRGMFKALGRTSECQEVQTRFAGKLLRDARQLLKDYGLWSDRALALMFDIKVQNGSIKDITRAQILADFERLPDGLSKPGLEVEKMKIIAHRRAEAANPKWVEDVRSRKLCIAKGEGVVHGVHYNLAEQFGISLES